MTEFLELDGSYGEGGGQVLRTALTLSALLSRPVHLRQIRADRPKPGLAPQHLTTVLAVAKTCDAEVQGARLGSTDLWFAPRRQPEGGTYSFDVTHAAQGGSAGAVSLVWQTLLLPLAYAATPSHLTLKGGTHVPWSPPFDYLAAVFLPTVTRLGLAATLALDAWGFYPVGGGVLRSEISPLAPDNNPSPSPSPERRGEPSKGEGAAPLPSPSRLGRGQGVGSHPPAPLSPLTLTERGSLKRVRGDGVACNLPAAIAQRIANRATNVLRGRQLAVDITPRRVGGPGMGAGLFLVAEYEHALAGFAALGAKGKPSDQVADEACQALLAHHATEAAVDPHLADQLLLPLALAAGRSALTTSEVTGHLLTNAYVIQQFLPVSVEITGREGQPGQVTIAPLRP